MQQEHKLNGFPYKEFERIGLDSQKLYRIKRKNKKIKDKEVLKIVFNQKYGELGTVEEKLFHYYVSKAIKIKYLPLNVRVLKLTELKQKLYLTRQLFNISEKTLDNVWEEISKYYEV